MTDPEQSPLTDAEEIIVLVAIVAAMFVAAAAIGVNVRGGQPWAF